MQCSKTGTRAFGKGKWRDQDKKTRKGGRVRKGIANICDIFPTLQRGKGMLIPENLAPNLLV